MADRTGAGTQVRVAMKQSLLALVVACGLVFLGAEAWAWQTNITGTAGGGEFRAVAVDGGGNIVAAGALNNMGGRAAFAVVKLDGASGAELWRNSIDGQDPYYFAANTVTVDGVGNVVAGGWWGYRTTITVSAFIVVKLDGASGAEMWRYLDSGGGEGFFHSVEAVAVDGNGDVVAVGTTGYSYPDGPAFTVVKLNGITGAVLWRQVIHTFNDDYIDEARAVAVDETGNVVAAGRLSGFDFGVIKFEGASGAELWRHVIQHTGSFANIGANAVAVNGTGNVVAAGSIANTVTGADFLVTTLDGATGTELWRHVINGTANRSDAANTVTIDSAANVLVAGFTTNTGTEEDFTVVKVEGASGTELWRAIINGAANHYDAALAAAMDGVGNVTVEGWIRNATDSSVSDVTVAKFDGASGERRWLKVLGNATGSLEGNGVLLDNVGDVIAAGAVNNAAMVAKLRGTDGSDFVPDTEPPTVTMTAPANLAIVSGTVIVSAEASDNVGVVGVQFQLDGAPLGAEDTEVPYAVTWNTSGTIVGIHKLTAVARDAGGNSRTSAPVTVTVVNPPSLGILP